jgi:hypothetical protein
MYALRHSSIVRMLLQNIPIRLVASLHNTSTTMIERTYSRFPMSTPFGNQDTIQSPAARKCFVGDASLNRRARHKGIERPPTAARDGHPDGDAEMWVLIVRAISRGGLGNDAGSQTVDVPDELIRVFGVDAVPG